MEDALLSTFLMLSFLLLAVCPRYDRSNSAIESLPIFKVMSTQNPGAKGITNVAAAVRVLKQHRSNGRKSQTAIGKHCLGPPIHTGRVRGITYEL